MFMTLTPELFISFKLVISTDAPFFTFFEKIFNFNKKSQMHSCF
jgi:hypothetical protein